ncbi:MAG TPA: Nramp family divalent metal transporter [Chloroflexota bacterium]|nr:Nramp family divalent metal transporter [Chloroflexota bacterium]
MSSTSVTGQLGAQFRTGPVRLLSPRSVAPYLGPAFLVSVGYMDPGNWATDIEGGARFGYTLLWVLLSANLMALLLQHLSAKLGLATGMSYPELCRANLSKPLTLFLWVTAEAAAIATDLAEFLGAALGFYLLLHIPMFPAALITAVAVFGILALYRYGYRAVEWVIMGLVAVIGLAYVFEVWLVQPDWRAVTEGALVPRLNADSLVIAMGMLGATVMPHNLYLHSGVILSRRRLNPEHTSSVTKAAMLDSVLALNLAWLVNSAIVIMAAAAFYTQGLEIDSIEGAHATLTPLLGGLSAVAFAVALLASGLSSSTTATLAGQIIIEGFLNVKFGLFLRRLITVIPALVVIAMGLDAYWILILSQVSLSVQLPFAIVPLVWLTSRKSIMGEHANHPATTAVASVIAALIIGLNVLLLLRLTGLLE